MEGKVEIVINGVTYPCRPTMGAALRFKQETGKEITEVSATDLTCMCTYMWCCVQSGANAAKMDFGLTLMDFADSITSSDVMAWSAAVQQVEGQAVKPGVQKKR